MENRAQSSGRTLRGRGVREAFVGAKLFSGTSCTHGARDREGAPISRWHENVRETGGEDQLGSSLRGVAPN